MADLDRLKLPNKTIWAIAKYLESDLNFRVSIDYASRFDVPYIYFFINIQNEPFMEVAYICHELARVATLNDVYLQVQSILKQLEASDKTLSYEEFVTGVVAYSLLE